MAVWLNQIQPEVGKGKRKGSAGLVNLWSPKEIGVSGFEPEASWTRTKRDTKLRHTPMRLK